MGGLRDSSAVRFGSKRALRLLVGVFLACFVTLVSTEPVGAICNTAISPDQWREASAVVFRGRVVEAYGAGKGGYSSDGARMEVLRVWKGDVSGTVDVRPGLPNLVEPTRYFLPGVEYLVYAQGQGMDLTLQFCSPMTPVSQARDELLYLNYRIPMDWTGRLVALVAALAALSLLVEAARRFTRRARGVLAA